MRGKPLSLFEPLEEGDRFFFERQLFQRGYACIAGTDEVGRGPLAGPVVAASVVLPRECDVSGFDDSKKLSRDRRERLVLELERIDAVTSCAVVDEQTIDKINILQASLLAMKQSLMALSVSPDYILVDGKFQVPLTIPQTPLVKGDGRSASIAAASILAKVTRDKIMCDYHRRYPQYGFDRHKGYPTREHRQAIKKFGITPIHRKSFKGVREYVVK